MAPGAPAGQLGVTRLGLTLWLLAACGGPTPADAPLPSSASAAPSAALTPRTPDAPGAGSRAATIAPPRTAPKPEVALPADPFPELARTLELAVRQCTSPVAAGRTLDLNRDGKPDVWKFYDGAAMSCRKSDLNFDGKIDSTTGYGDSGSALFHQYDLDFDGRFEVHVALNPSGKPAFTARDSNGDGAHDTLERHDENSSAIYEVARDRNGDRRADLWEIHDGTTSRVFADDDFDGSFIEREPTP